MKRKDLGINRPHLNLAASSANLWSKANYFTFLALIVSIHWIRSFKFLASKVQNNLKFICLLSWEHFLCIVKRKRNTLVKVESGAEGTTCLVPYVFLRPSQETPNFKDFLPSYPIIEHVFVETIIHCDGCYT